MIEIIVITNLSQGSFIIRDGFVIILSMERYVYLFLGLALLLPLLGVLLWRKDLTHTALRLGLFGGLAGLGSELLYFRDYWRPPSLSGIATVSIEDFIFGFAITALSFVAYPSVARYTLRRDGHKNRSQLYLVFFVASIIALLFFNLYLHINSIFVSYGIFTILSAVILLMRRDLLSPALFSAVALTSLVIIIYIVLFNIVSPDFWNKYWLLADTKWGVTILGNLPLTELLWYASWIFFASISYPFASGRSLSKLK